MVKERMIATNMINQDRQAVPYIVEQI